MPVPVRSAKSPLSVFTRRREMGERDGLPRRGQRRGVGVVAVGETGVRPRHLDRARVIDGGRVRVGDRVPRVDHGTGARVDDHVPVRRLGGRADDVPGEQAALVRGIDDQVGGRREPELTRAGRRGGGGLRLRRAHPRPQGLRCLADRAAANPAEGTAAVEAEHDLAVEHGHSGELLLQAQGAPGRTTTRVGELEVARIDAERRGETVQRPPRELAGAERRVEAAAVGEQLGRAGGARAGGAVAPDDVGRRGGGGEQPDGDCERRQPRPDPTHSAHPRPTLSHLPTA